MQYMYERAEGFNPLFYNEIEASEDLRELGVVEILRKPAKTTAVAWPGIEWDTALFSVRAIYEEDSQPAHEIRVRNTEEDIPYSFSIDPRDDGSLWVGTVSGNDLDDLVRLNDVQSEGLRALLDQSIDAGLQYPDQAVYWSNTSSSED